MNILALDLATKCGFALSEGGRIESGVAAFEVRRHESPGIRWIRFNRWLEEIGARADIIVFERWVRHTKGAAGEITAGFTTRVSEYAARAGKEHLAVSPSDLKRWTTGKGNAPKPAMVAAVRGRWAPDVTDDNQADALALLHYALAELVPEHHPSGVVWQARWGIVAVEMAGLALADERIAARIGKPDFDPSVASLIFAEASPLCCFLGEGAVGTLREKLVEKIAVIKRARIERGEAS